MRHTLYTLFSFALACLSGGCITEYTPRGLEGHESLLVVDGIISDGETVIKLSQSIALEQPEGESIYMPDLRISDAEVRIEGDNGDSFGATLVNPGEYSALGIILSDDVRYRLRISWQGEEYESEWRNPQTTPPIEKIAFNEKDGQLQVRLDVSGDPGTLGYYLWNYNETWEIHAHTMATEYLGRWDGDYGEFGFGWSYKDLNPYSGLTSRAYPGGYSQYYYCWKYDNSRSLLLGSTERLTENTLRDYLLYEFDISDDRISVLYHTKISQYLLGEDAYYYFSNQRSNTDETGSIFAPVPSEMPGNIVCTSSPEILVIGFVEVSRRAQREIFLDTVGSPYKMPPTDCKVLSNTTISEMAKDISLEEGYSQAQEFIESFFLVYNSGDEEQWYTTIPCLDCRQSGGGKIRPNWWPNDHF